METVLSIQNLKKYYGATKAVEDISFTVDAGEVVVIIGPSDAGKSTVLRCINRMIEPTEGSILFEGHDMAKIKKEKDLKAMRRRIGMIFQSFNLITRTTVIKNVLTAFVPDIPWWRATLGIFNKQEKMQALEALDKVGILDKAFVRADQLSGG